MTDTPLSHRIRSVRQTIWSSALYRRVRRIADLTRPFRRFELGLIFRLELTGPINVVDASVDIEIAQASADDVERAASLNPLRSRSELFRWRVQDGCVCFIARAGSTLVAHHWVRLRPGVDDGDMIALADGEAFHLDLYVDEKWRGSRVRAALTSRMLLFDKQRGYTAAYTKMNVFNRKAMKSARLRGWESAGLVLRVRGSRREAGP
jgi:GNAT superfamily N-acetyltransferase